MAGGKFQERMNKVGLKYIASIRTTLRALWRSACKHDGFPEDTSFAVFSDDNPFVPFHDKALTELWAAKREYAAGGYVGLTTTRRTI